MVWTGPLPWELVYHFSWKCVWISCICLAIEKGDYFLQSLGRLPVIWITFRFNGYSIVKIVFFLLFLCGEIFWVGRFFFFSLGPYSLFLFFSFFMCIIISPMLCPISLTFILYWSIAGEQCCHRFRWTVKGLSHTYTWIHSSPRLPSHPGCHIILNRVQLREGFKLYFSNRYQHPNQDI